MFRRKQDREAVTLNFAPARPAISPGDFGLHRVGETTGMFRARTAAGIQVEMEEEVDVNSLPENLRKFLVNHMAR